MEINNIPATSIVTIVKWIIIGWITVSFIHSSPELIRAIAELIK